MGKFNDRDKINALVALLKTGGNSVTVAELTSVLVTPRRARRAIFIARKDGMKLEAVRDTGKAVTGYVWINPPSATVTPLETKVSVAADAVTAKVAVA